MFLSLIVKEKQCSFDPKPGKCSMNLTKFYYNIQTRECELFVYSGCGGNGNNFMSILECETRCRQGQKLFNSYLAKPQLNMTPQVLSRYLEFMPSFYLYLT